MSAGRFFRSVFPSTLLAGVIVRGDIVRTGSGGTRKLWQAGSTASGTPGATGARGWTEVTGRYAPLSVVCDSSDSLGTSTNISVTANDVALIYRGTAAGGSGAVRSISIPDPRPSVIARGGEIHILSGSVSTPDDGNTGTNVETVLINRARSATPLRLVVAAGASVTNLDTSTLSDAIYVSGGGDVFASIAGNTSTAGRRGISIQAGGSGNVDLDVTGGIHSAPRDAVLGSIVLNGTGSVDIDVTGGILYGGGTSGGVVASSGRAGTDSITIGPGVVVCRGTYSSGLCTPAAVGVGSAIYMTKEAPRTGTMTVSNSGNVWGDIRFLLMVTIATTTTNEAEGTILGNFVLGNGNDVVSNAGIWIFNGFSNTYGGTDSFTNSGVMGVRYATATVEIRNVETITLNSGGILSFSVPDNTAIASALLGIQGAAHTLAGTVDIVTSNGSALPTSGTYTLITGTSIGSSTDTTNLRLAAHLGGTLSRFGTNIVLTLSSTIPTNICGSPRTRTVATPGNANMEVVCDTADTLVSSVVSNTAARVAILYRGTPDNFMQNAKRILNTGDGGEIHILSGSLLLLDDGGSGALDAVRLAPASGTAPLRLVMAAGTSVTNRDATAGTQAISVIGGGDVFVSVAGDTSAAGGDAIYVEARGSGDLDLDITGGTHRSSGNANSVRAFIASGGTGALDVDITGGVLHGASSARAVFWPQGAAGGADTVTIGRDAVVCRGTFSAGSCARGNGFSIFFSKPNGTLTGSMTLTNAGHIWGNVAMSVPRPQGTGGVPTTVTNEASGVIVGYVSGNGGNDVFTNAGTWTLSSDLDFDSGTDSFTNSGTLILHWTTPRNHGMTMRNLETFVLTPTSTVIFSLENANPVAHLAAILRTGPDGIGASILSFEGNPNITLTGTINIFVRDGSTIPASRRIPLFNGTTIDSNTDISGLSAVGISGTFSVDGDNNVIFTVADPSPVCGATMTRQVTAPGYANMNMLCDSADSLGTSSDIIARAARVAIRYRGTQSGGSGAVRSIENTGAGGEIHIESGSVSRADDDAVTARDAVMLFNAGTSPLMLVLDSDASVTNLDTTAGSDAIYAYGGGGVFLEIAGNTSAAGGVAIFVQAGGTGDVDLDITGGTHRGATGAVDARIANLGTGIVDIDISGSAVLFASGGAPIQLRGRGGADTLDIERNVVVCRGTYASRRCTASSGDAIFVNKNNSDTGSVAITTAGRINGDITVGTGSFSVTVTNEERGTVVGNFTSRSTGTTVITNAGTWTLSGESAFGVGSDSFVNEGRLILDYKGTAISLTGLETFTQATGATLRVEIDPRGADPNDRTNDGLPGSGEALLDVGSASGTVAGRLEIVILDTISATALEALITDDTERSVFASGHSLTTSALQLAGGVQRAGTGVISYDLDSVPIGQEDEGAVVAGASQKATAQTYDSLVQSGWFATRSIVRTMTSDDFMMAAECFVADAFSQRSGEMWFLSGACGWMNLGGRFYTHESSTVGAKETTENVFTLSGGLQMPVEVMGYDPVVSFMMGYEFSDVEFERGTGDGNRLLMGMGVSGSFKTVPVDIFAGWSLNYTTYEVERSAGISAEPEVLSVGGYGSVGYRRNVTLAGFGEFMIRPRVQLDIVGVTMEGFMETGGAKVGDVEATLVSFTIPSVLVSRVDELHTGMFRGALMGMLLESWLEIGVLVFASDPELEYKVDDTKATGSLEQAFAELSIGASLMRERMEFILFWDGVFGADTSSNTITLKAKYAF